VRGEREHRREVRREEKEVLQASEVVMPLSFCFVCDELSPKISTETKKGFGTQLRG
jgi:hypothetical protein